MSRPLPLPFTVPIKGVSFRQEEVVLLQEGTLCRVVHEPDNEYDTNACAIYTPSGGKLGFIPAQIAGRLALRGEGAWRARIVEVRKGDTWGASILVEGPLHPAAEETVAAPEEALEPVKPSAPVEVVSRSERLLGVLVKDEGNKVVVRNSQGVEISYPADLVQVRRDN